MVGGSRGSRGSQARPSLFSPQEQTSHFSYLFNWTSEHLQTGDLFRFQGGCALPGPPLPMRHEADHFSIMGRNGIPETWRCLGGKGRWL